MDYLGSCGLAFNESSLACIDIYIYINGGMHASLCACAGFRGSESSAHMVTWHPPCKALGLGRGRFTLNIRQIIYIYIWPRAAAEKKLTSFRYPTA